MGCRTGYEPTWRLIKGAGVHAGLGVEAGVCDSGPAKLMV